MISKLKPFHEITTEAIHILCSEIGLVNTIRFLNQFTTGSGNYTAYCFRRKQYDHSFFMIMVRGVIFPHFNLFELFMNFCHEDAKSLRILKLN